MSETFKAGDTGPLPSKAHNQIMTELYATGGAVSSYGPCTLCGCKASIPLNPAEWALHMAAHRIERLEGGRGGSTSG